jgi:hypothetical protein
MKSLKFIDTNVCKGEKKGDLSSMGFSVSPCRRHRSIGFGGGVESWLFRYIALRLCSRRCLFHYHFGMNFLQLGGFDFLGPEKSDEAGGKWSRIATYLAERLLTSRGAAAIHRYPHQRRAFQLERRLFDDRWQPRIPSTLQPYRHVACRRRIISIVSSREV